MILNLLATSPCFAFLSVRFKLSNAFHASIAELSVGNSYNFARIVSGSGYFQSCNTKLRSYTSDLSLLVSEGLVFCSSFSWHESLSLFERLGCCKDPKGKNGFILNRLCASESKKKKLITNLAFTRKNVLVQQALFMKSSDSQWSFLVKQQALILHINISEFGAFHTVHQFIYQSRWYSLPIRYQHQSFVLHVVHMLLLLCHQLWVPPINRVKILLLLQLVHHN